MKKLGHLPLAVRWPATKIGLKRPNKMKTKGLQERAPASTADKNQACN
jgi:hypothetical protein